ncbi:phosphatidate cytidylyltransferase [Roseococcus sp. YIM B11640]|uniref:phosphatidate cytidylyltransferase n=1 Tax=Roseococcus sp. YIM B11640 TaxID=3133973 RepID=UPI003C7A219C
MGNWGDLRKRALTAALLGPLSLICVWVGGVWWAGLLGLSLLAMAWEWARLCGSTIARLPGMLMLTIALASLVCALAGWPAEGLALALGGAVLIALAGRSYGSDRWAWLAFGAAYLGAAGVALIFLRGDPDVGRANIIFLLAIVWSSDISAYVIGRAFGGPKLAPAISPNKTWSGAMGGLVGASLVGLVATMLTGSWGSFGWAILVAAILGVATQAGDIFESWMKRRFGVKDSSGLIPGHGGVLDRLDGLLAAAPMAALVGAANGATMLLWR